MINGKYITQVYPGAMNMIALDDSNNVYTWGSNLFGQLGNNSTSTSQSNIPINITSSGSINEKTIIRIFAGSYHLIVLDSTGGIHTWGLNNYRQLGDSSHAQSNKPIYINPDNFPTYINPIFINFTGQHKCFLSNILPQNQFLYQGLIVVADQNKYIDDYATVQGKDAITINESLPLVTLSSKKQDKKVFGVISLMPNYIQYPYTYSDVLKLRNEGDSRVEINSIGEGAIWITDENGPLESGDYIISSSVPGYGTKQLDDILHNYSVAKSTMDCDFNPQLVPKQIVKVDSNGNKVLDSNGFLIWETEYRYSKEETVIDPDTGATHTIIVPIDPPEIIMEPLYVINYVTNDGTVISLDEYNKQIGLAPDDPNKIPVYKAAFIGCTYHCG
jgi:hypothetical protein